MNTSAKLPRRLSSHLSSLPVGGTLSLGCALINGRTQANEPLALSGIVRTDAGWRVQAYDSEGTRDDYEPSDISRNALRNLLANL